MTVARALPVAFSFRVQRVLNLAYQDLQIRDVPEGERERESREESPTLWREREL